MKDSLTLEGQTKALIAYCEKMGYELLECHIYPEAETAYNKPFREREQLMRMLDDAKKKRFDVIVITEFSRLARRQEEQTVLIALFKEYGVRVESIAEKLPDEDSIASASRASYGFASEIEHDRADPQLIRAKVEAIREEAKLPIDASVTKGSLADIARRMNNLYKLAADATDDGILNDLKAMLRDLERQKHKIEAIKYDLEEEERKVQNLYTEIERFEKWCDEVRLRFANPECQAEITYEEKRLAIQILHVVAIIQPSSQKERIELTVVSPNITKLLNDLVCQGSQRRCAG